MMPTSQNTYTSARLLRLANSTMLSKMLPLVDEVQEDYYSYDVDTALNATGIYDLHTRAVGGKIIDASLINGSDQYGLTRYYQHEISNFQAPQGDYGFYLKRNQIILLPTTPSGWTSLRQTILLRPETFVAQEDAAQITAINTGTGVITCSTVPSTWTTANTFDMVQQKAHFDTLSIDLPISAITTGSSGTLTFSPSSLSSRLAVGDWIGLAGESTVIQLPVELLPLLAQECANFVLKSQGDAKNLEHGMGAAKEMREGLVGLITPRVQKEGKKIVNRTGLLRRGV